MLLGMFPSSTLLSTKGGSSISLVALVVLLSLDLPSPLLLSELRSDVLGYLTFFLFCSWWISAVIFFFNCRIGMVPFCSAVEEVRFWQKSG